MIDKTASDITTERFSTLYYRQARQGMHDVIEKMHSAGMIEHVYIPGYVGWSPKEGSGIFDSISTVKGIDICYYKMTYDLWIDENDLFQKVNADKSLVLIVNYFGFRDNKAFSIIEKLKERNVYIMEDNAHGFFTWHEHKELDSDIVIFSLHKMFPFEDGGSLIIRNPSLIKLPLTGKAFPEINKNPYDYRVHEIAEKRKGNYAALQKALLFAENNGFVESIRSLGYLHDNVPQTYPIRIKIGDRNRIYSLMNDAGFGVVSLYHTMIDGLRNEDNMEAVQLSKCILNLPVHQDVNMDEYAQMTECLINACKITEGDMDD